MKSNQPSKVQILDPISGIVIDLVDIHQCAMLTTCRVPETVFEISE